MSALLHLRLLPWIAALLWFIARVIASKWMGIDEAKNFGVLSNMLLILLLIFFAIYHQYRKAATEPTRFFEDLKACMKPALKYVLAVTIGIAVHYGFLSDDLRIIREAHIASFNAGIASEETFNQFRKDHPDYANATRDELMKTNMENVERNVSVQTWILGALLALTFVSLVYSLLAVFFWRTMVRRM